MEEEINIKIKTKCEMLKKMKMEEYKQKSNDLDDKERELCRKTNQLVDELLAVCDNSPFQKALLKLLSNMKGNLAL